MSVIVYESDWLTYLHWFLQGVSVAASPVLATIGMSVRLSVCPSVRHTLALSENDAS